MAAKVKLSWVELEPAMFPEDVQKAVAKVHATSAALSEKFKALPEYKAQQAAIAAADALIMPYAPRIALPNDAGELVKVVKAGETMEIGYRYNKLTVASKPKGKAKTSNVVLA